MPKMLGLTYYNIKMLKNDFFSSLLGKGRGGWLKPIAETNR